MDLSKFELNTIYTRKSIEDSFDQIEEHGRDIIGAKLLLCWKKTKRYSFISAGVMFASGFSYKLIFIYPPESK